MSINTLHKGDDDDDDDDDDDNNNNNNNFNNRTKFTVPTPIKIVLLRSVLSPAH